MKKVYVASGADSSRIAGILQKIYGPKVDVFWSDIEGKMQEEGRVDAFFFSAFLVMNGSVSAHEMKEKYGEAHAPVIAISSIPQHRQLALNGNYGVTHELNKDTLLSAVIYDPSSDERALLLSYLVPTRISA